MPLSAGTRLGPYEILAPMGAGGMGEVYKARDSRLGRDVALKILPAAFASDADRVRRFEQEGRAAAALNHLNIVVVHDVGLQDGVFYVPPSCWRGETLRERLAGPALPVRKATVGAIVQGAFCVISSIRPASSAPQCTASVRSSLPVSRRETACHPRRLRARNPTPVRQTAAWAHQAGTSYP
jgi:hypothetical protein